MGRQRCWVFLEYFGNYCWLGYDMSQYVLRRFLIENPQNQETTDQQVHEELHINLLSSIR